MAWSLWLRVWSLDTKQSFTRASSGAAESASRAVQPFEALASIMLMKEAEAFGHVGRAESPPAALCHAAAAAHLRHLTSSITLSLLPSAPREYQRTAALLNLAYLVRRWGNIGAVSQEMFHKRSAEREMSLITSSERLWYYLGNVISVIIDMLLLLHHIKRREIDALSNAWRRSNGLLKVCRGTLQASSGLIWSSWIVQQRSCLLF